MADIIRTTDPGADAKYGQPSGTVYGYDPSVGKYTQTGAPNPEGTLPDGSERLGEIGVNQSLDPVSPTRDLHRPEVETKKAEPKPDKTDGNPPQNAPGQFRTKKPERKSTWQKLNDKAEAAKQAAADFHLGTRALGVVQGVQSTVLGVGAGAAAVATAPSVIGAVGFGAAALNEFDQAVAGFRTAWSGEPTDTLVQTAAKWGATAAGVAPEQVEQVGEATGLLQGVIGANPSVAASKAATREAERLAQKEAQAAAEAPAGKSGKSETTTEGQTKDNVKVEEEQPKQGERQKDADCKGCITNPVQVSNGANRYAEIEFALPGPLPFDLTRSYNSAVGTIGPLGRGMRSSLDRAVVRHADGRLVYRDADHRDVFFPAPGPLPAGWTYNVRAPWLALAEGPDGSLILRDGAERHRFDRTAEGVWRIGAIERGGARITFARGPDGTLDRLDHPCGLVLRFANDAEGRRTGVTLVGSDGATSEILRYRYDARGNLLAAESTAGGSRFYEYDAADRCTFWRDDGRTWARHVYDGAGRVVRLETSGAWNGDTFTYDPERMRTRHTPGDRPDAFVWYGYDEEARIVAEEDAHGNVSRVLYDDSDQRIAEIDAEGRETRYAYDANGYLSAVTDPAGRTRRLFRDEAGHVVLRIDAPGEAWRFERDENGHLAAVVDPLDHRTDLSHDAAGRLLGTMRHDGLIERRRYDAGGRLSAIRDFRDGETRYEHDAFGRVTAIEDPLGARTTFAYAPGGDFWVPARETRADGVTLERRIDRGRAEVALTDGEGRRTIRRYGAYGVLEEIEDPQGGRVRFTYDGRKQLTRVTNALGRHWTFTRDACGRVVSETDFDGRTTAYAYDRSGRLTGRTEADGTRLAYAYDAAGLLLAETVSAADGSAPQVTRFAYDRAGRLVRAQNREARVELERDALGQVVAETVNGRRIASTYDCCGHRTARTGLGAAVASVYDPLGALAELRIGEHAPLSLGRDAAGRERHRATPVGFRLESRHDAVGRLVRQVGGWVGGPDAPAEPALERVYGWNRASEPVSIADRRWGATGYGYDGNGQVEEARHGDGLAERFDYDAALNVSAFQELDRGPGGPVQAASLLEAAPDTRLRFWHGSAGGRVREAWGPQGERVTYRHDGLGRVVERRLERNGFRPLTWSYGWDGRDRLVSCETPTGEVWSYGYDPFGRRLWKRRTDAASGGSVGTAYGWDGDLLSAEAPLRSDGSADWGSATVWHYEPGTFRPVAREGSDGSLLYVVTDHLGTPRELLDESGRAVWSAEYRLWGAVRRVWVAANDDEAGGVGPGGGRVHAVAGNLALASDPGVVEAVLLCPLRFQGQWQDGETGLVYNRFRYYDPLTAQYASPDPLGIVGGYNLNSYVESPVSATDPFGLADDPVVTAEFTIGGRTFTGYNPTHYDPRNPNVPIPGLSAINNNLNKSHAEINAMQQAYDAGFRGGSGQLNIYGKNACPYCQSDIKKMGMKLGLDELNVTDADGKTYRFKGDDLKAKKDGGKSFKEGCC